MGGRCDVGDWWFCVVICRVFDPKFIPVRSPSISIVVSGVGVRV